MTPTAVNPMKKKVNAILKMERPKNRTQIRSFIGAVNYYKSLWPRQAHFMKPLTALTSKKVDFQWGPDQQQAFDTLKSIMAEDFLNAYPNYNQRFEIYTDASNYQLGAAIIQNGRPVAYWSRSLQPTQQKYTTTEKELLAIILCLKEYEKILYGAKQIKVFTDHKNLTFNTLSVKRVLQWRTYIDQFGVDLCYIEGKRNVLADCFSRLPRMKQSFKEGGRSSSLQTVTELNQVSVNDNDGKNQSWK